MEKETKKSIVVFVFSVLIPVIFVCLFFRENETMVRIEIGNIVELKEEIKGKIDEIHIDEENIIIKGWAFREVPYVIHRNVLLRNMEDKNEIWQLNTVLEEKTVLSDGFGERAYINAGFSGNGRISEEMRGKEYEVLIYIQDTESNYIFNTEEKVEF